MAREASHSVRPHRTGTVIVSGTPAAVGSRQRWTATVAARKRSGTWMNRRPVQEEKSITANRLGNSSSHSRGARKQIQT